MFKVGDKVNVLDGSYSFGIEDGRYSHWCHDHNGNRNGLIVVETGLSAMAKEFGNRSGPDTWVCNILVKNDRGGFWFTQERYCVLAEKKITVRYFDENDKDVTDKISDETKKNLQQS